MNRKLAAAIAIVSAMHAGVLHALGLGEITLKSHLNEPLEAEIRLQNVGDLASQQILVELASKADFQRAGIERDYFLTSLQFEVKLDGRGDGVLKVKTPGLVREPFVNFILEARWPSGRLLREYTLLLDPPRYSALPAKKINTPSSGDSSPSGYTPGGGVYNTTGRAPSVASPSSSAPPSSRSMASADSSAYSSAPSPSGTVTVLRDDTLWDIAKAVKPSGMTVKQTVAALHRANPEAFIRNNINLLKSGAVLRIPSAEEVAGYSTREARGFFNTQMDEWRELTGSEPSRSASLDARPSSSYSKRSASQQDGHLQLAAAPPKKTTAVDSDFDSKQVGAEVERLRSELALSLESLDKASVENEEMSSRLDELETHLSDLERLLSLKDEELSKLRQAIAMRKEQMAAMEDDGLPSDGAAASLEESLIDEAEAAAEAADAVIDDLDEQLDSAVTDAAEAVDGAVDETLDTELFDDATESVADTAEAAPEEELAVEEPVSVWNTAPAPKPAPVEPPKVEPKESGSLLDKLIFSQSKLLLGGLAGLLLLLFGGIGAWFFMRNRDDSDYEAAVFTWDDKEDDVDEVEEADSTSEQGPVDLAPQSDATDADELAEEEGEALEDDIELSTDLSEEAIAASSNPFAEADIYVAYGRFDQAADVLNRALEEEPNNADLYLKLLELRVAQGDAQAFNSDCRRLMALNNTSVNDEAKALLSGVSDTEGWWPDTTAPIESDAPIEYKTSTDDSAAEALSNATDTLETVDAASDSFIEPVGEVADSLSDAEDDLDLDLGALDESVDSALQDSSLDLDESLQELDDISNDLSSEDFTAESLDVELDSDASDVSSEESVSELEPVSAEDKSTDPNANLQLAYDADSSDEEVLSQAQTSDEVGTKLDLARAYIEMGDEEGARDILEEVMEEGDNEQQEEAQQLLSRMAS